MNRLGVGKLSGAFGQKVLFHIYIQFQKIFNNGAQSDSCQPFGFLQICFLRQIAFAEGISQRFQQGGIFVDDALGKAGEQLQVDCGRVFLLAAEGNKIIRIIRGENKVPLGEVPGLVKAGIGTGAEND